MPISSWSSDDELTSARLNELVDGVNNAVLGVLSGLNVDSGVLYVDATNNRVGINDITPSVALDVTGAGAFSGALAVTGALTATSTSNLFTKLGVGEEVAASNVTLAVVDNTLTVDSVVADFSASLTAGSQDTGTARFTISQMVAGTGTLMRAFEAHTLRDSAAITPVGSWIGELGLHSEVASSGPIDGAGLRIESGNFTPTITGAVRQGAALAIVGAAGWSDALYYLDTDNSTVLARITQTGQIEAGNVVSRTASTFSLGATANRWLAAYLDNCLMTAGSATAPTVASRVDTTSGLYWPTTSQVGLTVGSADRAILSASGFTLDDPLILTQISTPSAPASGLTSLYAKSGGGIYSRANGGSEKQHKAGGQTGFASGSTGSPTTTSASYADLTDMSVTLTTTGGELLCWFAGALMHSDATRNIQVAFSLDGAAEVFPFSLGVAVANEPYQASCFARFTGVSAGSHTVKVRWLTDAATATANGTQRYLMVQELPS